MVCKPCNRVGFKIFGKLARSQYESILVGERLNEWALGNLDNNQFHCFDAPFDNWHDKVSIKLWQINCCSPYRG